MTDLHRKVLCVLVAAFAVLVLFVTMSNSDKGYFEMEKMNITKVSSEGLTELKENCVQEVEKKEKIKIEDSFIIIEEVRSDFNLKNFFKTGRLWERKTQAKFICLNDNEERTLYVIEMPYQEYFLASLERGEEINDPTGIELKEFFDKCAYKVSKNKIKLKGDCI